MLAEVIVAAALLGTLLAVCLQLVAAAAAYRRAADQREAALAALGNVMERLAARPWSELTASAVAKEKLPPAVTAQLPRAVLKIDVAPPAAEPKARQITATLRWEDAKGQLAAPLRLTTWRYQIGAK